MRTKPHIGIFGSYDVTSKGDLAILKSILTQLQETLPQSTTFTIFATAPQAVREIVKSEFPEVRVLPSRPRAGVARSNTDHTQGSTTLTGKLKRVASNIPIIYDPLVLTLHPRFWLQTLREVKNLDLLIIGGGGLLVDLYPRWPIYPLLFTAMAKLAHTPVMFYAVGAGPIKHFRGKIYFTIATNLSQAITVRDTRSFRTVQKMLVNKRKLHLAADPAFCLRQPQKRKTKSKEKPQIAISTVAIFRPGDWPTPNQRLYEIYTTRMAELAKTLADTLPAQITFFSTNCPQDLLTAADILKKVPLPEEHISLLSDCSLNGVCNFLPNTDLVIGTRLHSMILSAACGVPIIALSYQEKVETCCKDMGIADLVFPLNRLILGKEDDFRATLEEIVQNAQAILQNENAERERFTELAKQMCVKAKKSAQIALSLLRSNCSAAKDTKKDSKTTNFAN